MLHLYFTRILLQRRAPHINVTYADISKSTFAGCCNTLAESHFVTFADIFKVRLRDVAIRLRNHI